MTSDNAAGRHTVEYAYDALDRVILRTVDGSDPTAYTYDKASRPSLGQLVIMMGA